MAEFNLNPISSNILNRYSSYTYNFKLYAVDQGAYNNITNQSIDFEEIHKSNAIKKARKAVIAESGVTNLKIDDVSISSRPSNTDATFITNVSFKITQPKGFSFIESMVAAGTLCGWEGFFSSPFLIFEISFKGWEGESGKGTTVKTISIPIQITNVNTEMDGGGSRYSIEAAVMFQSHRQVYSSTISSMTIDDCDTFSQFLTKLQAKINEEAKKDQSNGDVLTTIHKFEADEDIGSMKLSTPKDSGHPLFNHSGNSEGSGASYSISNQYSIPKLLESVLLTSPDVQKKLEGDEDSKMIFGTTFQIDPVVKSEDYNPIAGEYTYQITWKVRFAPTMLLRNRGVSSSEALKILVDDKYTRFRRVYSHYFTGMNSEVLNVNMETNKLYFNKLTRYENLFINETNSKGMKKGDTNLTEERKKSVANITEQQAQNKKEMIEQSKLKNSLDSGEEVYVDDVSVASIERLSKFRYMYRFARDTQGSVPQKTAPDYSGSKTQDMHDLLRNTRNKLELSALRLELEIRGDPYWLSPMNGNYEIDSGERLSSLRSNIIGFKTGFPNEIQESGVRNDYMFSGLYIVVNVTSSFNAGKFTQKLECARIVDVDSGTFLKNYGDDN